MNAEKDVVMADVQVKEIGNGGTQHSVPSEGGMTAGKGSNLDSFDSAKVCSQFFGIKC